MPPSLLQHVVESSLHRCPFGDVGSLSLQGRYAMVLRYLGGSLLRGIPECARPIPRLIENASQLGLQRSMEWRAKPASAAGVTNSTF